jgi:hypothetical protein
LLIFNKFNFLQKNSVKIEIFSRIKKQIGTFTGQYFVSALYIASFSFCIYIILEFMAHNMPVFSAAIFTIIAIIATSYKALAGGISIAFAFDEAVLYPNNILQAESINSTLFADNIQGRVDITNTFDGRELNTEYVFGLFANIAKNDTFSLLPVPVASVPRGFISNGNMAAFSSLITFRHIATGVELPIIVDTWLLVNDEGKIEQYEATFVRHDWFFDTFYDMVTPFVAQALNIPVAALNDTYRQTVFQQLIAKSVCTIEEKYCLGPNQQYNSFDDCFGFMMSLPFGKSYAFGQNNAICRMLHQEMVPLRPDVHCEHIGPSGGGMCMDRNYTDVTEEVYFRQLFIEKPCN